MTLQAWMTKSGSRALLCMFGPKSSSSVLLCVFGMPEVGAQGDKRPPEMGGRFATRAQVGLGRGDGSYKGVLHRDGARPGQALWQLQHSLHWPPMQHHNC